MPSATSFFTLPVRTMSLFESMKGVPIPTTEAERNELVVTESSHGIWDYHLSRRANIMRSLCGTPTMPTAIPVSAWNAKVDENLPRHPTYCEACTRLAWPQGQADNGTTPGQSGRGG